MDQQRKLQSVKNRLGEPRISAKKKGEYVFVCCNPDCDSRTKDKAKLSVNIEKDWFNCWVCGFHGRNLLRIMVPGSADQREYAEGLPDRKSTIIQDRPTCSSIPQGYTPLDRRAPVTSAPYRTYLNRRGLDDHTLSLYRVGYVDVGDLTGRVIFPSFDARGNVNFWSARTIYPDVKPTYILPDASKDIISNEHMVDWKQPVYLVEGIFDEVAVGPQAIALYGKYLPMTLILKLVQERPPVTYICLDNDARSEAVTMLQKLLSYDVVASLVDIPGKDPGSVGYEAVATASAVSRVVTGPSGVLATRGHL